MTNVLKVYKECDVNYRQVRLNFKSGEAAKMYKNRILTYTTREDNMVSAEETIHDIHQAFIEK